MGPRLFSRGNSILPLVGSTYRIRLQWGRGFSAAEMALESPSGPHGTARFNGAAAFQPRKSVLWDLMPQPPFLLQWGRGFSAAEISGLRLRSNNRSELQWGRGFSAAEIWLPIADAHRAGRLQWGRGFSAAEIQATIQAAREMAELQWGRGFSAAEIPQVEPCGRLDQEPASMGPRLFSRGNSRKKRWPMPPPTASMGPRLFSRGNMGLVRAWRNWRRTSFNGAAAFQPRK